MRQLHTIAELQDWRQSVPAGKTVGFVPTMGALHRGHRALIERARRECDLVVVSIFVNPTQFNDPKDLHSYPQPLEKDLEACRDEGADLVFLPRRESMYPDDYRYVVHEREASLALEGKQRPGHFDGVLTVVLKLFNLVAPHRAYFGEKDWQQLQLVKEMAAALFLPLEVVPCETVRESDGLALSSRNVRLSPEARAQAPRFAAAMREAATAEEAAERLRGEGFAVEYVADRWGRRLGAVQLGGVRLIDNMPLSQTMAGGEG
ncbi:MAG: panC [Puniceicoccaceae bacterium 5H]|nr:MAG: panC [Puniceicoccaceae bacterium 5H]